jgi:4-alpha-glucanotransferase
MQDVLEIGSEGRMNLPGSLGGNWSWRLGPEGMSRARQERLAAVNRDAGRYRAG